MNELKKLWGCFRFSVEFFVGLLRVRNFVEPRYSFVTVLGSARFPENSPYYAGTVMLGEKLAAAGYGILTGGGLGLMEAANRGAKQGKNAPSYGYNVVLPHEQHLNDFLDKSGCTKHFCLRKILLFEYSCGFVVTPGGVGTMDEFFELLTLMQTRKMQNRPIFIYDTQYHEHLIRYLQFLEEEDAIDPLAETPVLFTDDIDFIVETMKTTDHAGNLG